MGDDQTGANDDGDTTDDTPTDAGRPDMSDNADKPSDDKPPTPRTYTEDDMRKVRDEAAGRRAALRTAEQERDRHRQDAEKASATLDAVRKAFGLDGDQEDPKTAAEKAAAERDASTAELRALRIERAAEKAARRAGADVDALLDSRAFATSLAKLDPAGDGFADDLTDLVDKTLEASPRLKAGKPAPPASSSEMTDGGETNNGQLTRAQLATMSPEEITAARKAGRLKRLLGG